MTQEQKDLLLKDLCARLPYDVKVKFIVNEVSAIEEKFIYNIDGEYSYITNGKSYLTLDIIKALFNNHLDEIKPYLFPLSSMTEEQKKDIFHNGKFYINRHNSLCRFPMYEDDYDFVTMEDCLEIFNKLNKYHFDYRGLIPLGLAIDATGKNIY